MKTRRVLVVSLTAIVCLLLCLQISAAAQSLKEQNEALLEQLKRVHGLSDAQMESIHPAVKNRSVRIEFYHQGKEQKNRAQ